MVEPNPIERQFIDNFLKSLRMTIAAGTFMLVNREKNNRFLMQMGFTVEDMFEILKALTIKDYVEGPKPDHSIQDHQVWVFGTRHSGTEIYIKVKVFQVEGNDYGKAISFHKAEYPLNFKFGR